MAGFANDVMVADNVNFTGLTGVPGKVATVTTNGQLLIGSTASPNIQVGVLTSPDSSISIGYSSPNITLQSGSAVLKSVPTDDGTATPSSGVLKILGATSSDYTQSGMVTHSDGTANEVYIENRLFLTKFVVDPSATIGVRGSYQTITAALAAASAGTTIYIRPGTYTENLTMVPGVVLTAASGLGGNPNVIIVGKCTFTTAGTYTCSNIVFKTNSDFAISVTGASAITVNFQNCSLFGTNFTVIQFSNSNASSFINVYNSQMDLQTTGIGYFAHSSAGGLAIDYTICSNSGGSSTASTQSAGALYFIHSVVRAPIATSGASATINALHSAFNTSVPSAVSIQHGCTYGDVNTRFNNCYFESGVSECITIGAGASLAVSDCCLFTTGASLTTGAGTLHYSGISSMTSTAVLATTSLIPLTLLPYAQSAASGSGSVRGTASFDSAVFTVTDGFVTLAGGSEAIDSVAMQTGTSPIVPTAAGLITLNGGTVAAGTNPVRSNGTGANTAEIQVQRSQAIASTDSTKVGLCNFNSARFSVDSNGFVDTAITGPTIQVLTSGTAATYTTPANCKWIWVRAWGGGAGGDGAGAGAGAGTNGANTTFSAGSMVAGKGTASYGAGTASSGGNIANYTGTYGAFASNVTLNVYGGVGGSTMLGGAGTGGNNSAGNGTHAQANSGSGGGGGGGSGTTGGGFGGSAGGYCESIITSPAASYTYTIGAGGTGGTAGTGGGAGGNGGSGVIFVVEYYI